ncbi:TnsA-like heteromeric transposase endonuclease subunit [Microbacterium sp. ISL-103]|uniref:TnsA-like heteromeric transposase endonuclease subunit n=1 Tax=Microbacterium sp. ISL-103 TaxID=2819156 RepID=UPI001BE6D5C3|nr:TnsA-like heteromeric transposase endonuclease subunit [Microbacterium sp. ISL-103]MBT2473641.1 TnsA-like heteromeric transposase endonuclease subunit [Microbacterium sp. ISL-103]
MAKITGIKKTPGFGVDRIEWKDAKHRVHAARATDPASVEKVEPAQPARLPMKWDTQRSSQGYYWCACTETMVRYESMSEFTALMLLDHVFDIVDIVSQPMMLTFQRDDLHHVPDVFFRTAQGENILVDVHDSERTTEAEALKFELTAQMCERIGWRFELFDTFPDVTRWNLEMMGRYHHPRFEPDDEDRDLILHVAHEVGTFGALRDALRTDRPGEHLPAVFHLMWQRAIRFDLTKPFSDNTPIHPA